MMNIKITLVVLIMIAGCVCYTDSDAEDVSKLSVRVTSDCAEYRLVDKVVLHVEIENRGPSPVVMYGKIGWGELGGLVLKISKENGKLIQPQALDDDMIIPSTLGDSSYYVTVFKNQFIGASRSGHAAEFFPGAGKYKIWAEYMSPVPQDSSLVKKAFWSMERGKTVSYPLTVTVGEGASCGGNGVKE